MKIIILHSKKEIGFSLVELMISLIVISIVTAAFTPILTKKLKTSDMSIGTASADYIFDETICSKSVSNCSICINSECVKCKEGYYLDENECKICSDNCTACTNSTSCTKCADGYYLDSSSCKECPLGCDTCSSIAKCKKCKTGYYLNENKCESCSTKLKGCADCSSDGSKCLSCISNCELCNSDMGCIKCKFGTYFDGKECAVCTKASAIATISNVNIYRFNMGDECGPAIPTGINICNPDTVCPYSVKSPICWVATNSIEGFTGYGANANYDVRTRTVCNWYAFNVANAVYLPVTYAQYVSIVGTSGGSVKAQLCSSGGISPVEDCRGKTGYLFDGYSHGLWPWRYQDQSGIGSYDCGTGCQNLESPLYYCWASDLASNGSRVGHTWSFVFSIPRSGFGSVGRAGAAYSMRFRI